MKKQKSRPEEANGEDRFTPDFFELDKDRLDEEWIEQPKLYYDAAARLADLREAWERAKVARDVATDDLKREMAVLDQAIRRDPSAFGIEKEKPSNPEVDAAVLLQEEYRKAKEAVYQAELKVIKKKHVADLADAEVRGLEHRRASLENLTALWGRNYWAEPRAPKGMEEEVREQQTARLRKSGQRRRSSH